MPTVAGQVEPPVSELDGSLVEELDAEIFDIFDDVDDAPADDATEDGADSLITVQPSGEYFREGAAVILSATKPRRRIAPFVRELKPRKPVMVGRDVRGVQRGLRARGHKLPVTGNYGAATVKAVKELQKKRGLQVDGVYGKATHKALAAAFDARAIALLIAAKRKQAEKPSILIQVQAKIEATAIFGYNNRYAISYSQGPRRMEGISQRLLPPDFPRATDCSAFAKWCYYVAYRTVSNKVRDPDGLDWAPWGYTGTLITQGRSGQKTRGGLGFYGPSWGNTGDVKISVGTGNMTIGQGSEAGPTLAPYNVRSDFLGWRVYQGAHYA